MSSRILQGDVFDMLPTITAGSVDCCIYSPPYWRLRSYLPKDHPLKSKELGSELTPEEYIANQVKVARLVRNCLADHGTVWINVGDSYLSEDVPHEAFYGSGGTRLEDYLGRDCPSESLCDACRGLEPDTVRRDSLPGPMPASSTCDPIQARRESENGHPATSGSSRQKRSRQSSSPKRGRKRNADHELALPLGSSATALPDESSRQLQDGNCQTSNDVSFPSGQDSSCAVSQESACISPESSGTDYCKADTVSLRDQPPHRKQRTAKSSPTCSDKGGTSLPRGESNSDSQRICSECGSAFYPQATDVEKAHRIIRGQTVQAGSLALIPQRLAIALADDGWLVRSVVVWHKPAPMPASVAGWRWMRCRVKEAPSKRAKVGSAHAEARTTPLGARNGADFDSTASWSDCPGCAKCRPNGGLVLRRGSWRPTSSWEPILMLAKRPGYFADGEGVKTAAKSATVSRDKYTRILDDPDEQFAVKHDHETQSAAGANLRDVWTPPDPVMRLRSDLTPEQRAFVLRRMLDAGSRPS